jgi:hypothetical protein
MSAGHGHGADHDYATPQNKRIALLIALLALVLAFSETLGKAAQTIALDANIEASNLWAFFQAKTIRMTTVRSFAEAADIEARYMPPGEPKAALEKQVESWKKSAARYDSEPETQEGRKELAARAKVATEKRDRALAAYHHYELASAAVQIAIVLASAAIITGIGGLVWLAIGLGVVGLGFSVIGFFFPTAIHLF